MKRIELQELAARIHDLDFWENEDNGISPEDIRNDLMNLEDAQEIIKYLVDKIESMNA